MRTSITKIYEEGGFQRRAYPISIGGSGSPIPKVQEDKSKLSGTLSLADLNNHRTANGLKTTLSEIDFHALIKKTEGSFQNFETDPTMNYRRNLYLWDMSEIVTPEASKTETS
ncbi:hypothetical protein [Aureimonas sp. N4]|uniref:hypothetical protein n=1 Tax=Aureimonas sp. N4 TaxID=1638165 RepID=UPI000AA8ECDA|nr:hypothetical protein [Aureimonas sp. N4]